MQMIVCTPPPLDRRRYENRRTSSEARRLALAAERTRRRAEIREARAAALRRLRILAPFLNVPVLVDMRCRPGVLRIDFPGGKRERDQRRAGQCRCKMERRKAERLIEVADGAG